jgi:hypothetical protein
MTDLTAFLEDPDFLQSTYAQYLAGPTQVQMEHAIKISSYATMKMKLSTELNDSELTTLLHAGIVALAIGLIDLKYHRNKPATLSHILKEMTGADVEWRIYRRLTFFIGFMQDKDAMLHQSETAMTPSLQDMCLIFNVILGFYANHSGYLYKHSKSFKSNCDKTIRMLTARMQDKFCAHTKEMLRELDKEKERRSRAVSEKMASDRKHKKEIHQLHEELAQSVSPSITSNVLDIFTSPI